MNMACSPVELNGPASGMRAAGQVLLVGRENAVGVPCLFA
jgi:hypothetical protein